MIDLAQPRSQRKQSLQCFVTALAVSLRVYLIKQQSWDQIEDAIRQISSWHLIITFGLICFLSMVIAFKSSPLFLH